MARSKTKSTRGDAPVAVGHDDMKWRARSALSTLAEAAQIRSDKPLMREVKKLHTSQGKALGVAKRGKREPM